jgi:hypothetical protein
LFWFPKVTAQEGIASDRMDIGKARSRQTGSHDTAPRSQIQHRRSCPLVSNEHSHQRVLHSRGALDLEALELFAATTPPSSHGVPHGKGETRGHTWCRLSARLAIRSSAPKPRAETPPVATT